LISSSLFTKIYDRRDLSCFNCTFFTFGARLSVYRIVINHIQPARFKREASTVDGVVYLTSSRRDLRLIAVHPFSVWTNIRDRKAFLPSISILLFCIFVAYVVHFCDRTFFGNVVQAHREIRSAIFPHLAVLLFRSRKLGSSQGTGRR